MTRPERQPAVLDLLRKLRGMDQLKQLFWTELNYQRVNQPLSSRPWPDTAAKVLAEDPILFAGGGQNTGFHVIYAKLASDGLRLGDERPVISQFLRDHPYALFIFSNRNQSRWHFTNVKYDDQAERRRVFRRITVGPEERLRTASERVAHLDLESISPDLFGLSPLAIQQRHDEAFDVEAVTEEFFKEYARLFRRVEQLTSGFTDPERKRLFTQRLFNRLMFIAFIQKKGWLKFDSQTDYLSALWEAYKRDRSRKTDFFSDRLKLLFFSGLSTSNEVNIIGINRGGSLRTDIGDVPYLNGGLFEEDDDDRNEKISVPDEAVDCILNELFERFNFTVTESTPLDIEVAVDPEMLGKVFEEMVTGRHETGSYYTPKPVVSFMCREALKGFLATQLAHESPNSIQQFVEEHNPAGLRNPEAALDALRKVRVCDPACGSGAYLLGMLHELLDLRACLFERKKLDAPSTFQRKLEIIQNNVYGVDIDPFAVNIARLRLWLSLAVDFEGDDPPPLPNLDFKIEVGDSLTAPNPEGVEQQAFRDELIRQFRESKARYMTAHGGEKLTLRKDVATLKGEVADWTHPNKKVSGFDWPVEFAEIFADGGFDIVVANPPYVRQELIKEQKPVLREVYPAVYTGTADLYCYFYARALQLLRQAGMLVFISPNKWFRAAYGGNLRKHIAETCGVFSITDFGELPVFKGSATFPMIFVAQKDKLGSTPVFTQVKSLEPPYPDVLALIREQGQSLPGQAIKGANWTLTDSASAARHRKMEAAGIPLGEYTKGQIYYGVKTGFNKAFVIDGQKRKELIAKDPRSKEIINPLAVGDDVRRWRIESKDKWLIVTRIGVDMKRYPAIFAHLKQWQTQLEKRWDKGNHWWELRPCDYYAAFDKPKIVFPDIGKEPRFAFDTTGSYINDTTFMICMDDLYLLGILNSVSLWNYFKSICAVIGDADKGGRIRLKRIYVSEVPIPVASAPDRAAISRAF